MNSFSAFVHGLAWQLRCPKKGQPLWHIPAEFVWYMTGILFLQGNPIPSSRMSVKYRLHGSCGC